MATLQMLKSVFANIVGTIGMRPPECGGVLGAREDGIVTEFYFDEHGKSTANGYAPDVSSINDMLARDWMPHGILMVGIVHSHSDMNDAPSCGDISYGIRILQALDTVNRFYIPIVTKSANGIELNCYVIQPDQERRFVCKKVDYMIAD